MTNINHRNLHAQRRSAWLIIQTLCLGLAVGATTMALAANTVDGWPETQTLMNAAQNDVNWILPAKSYEAVKVHETTVRLSYTGTPLERFWVDRKVSYADLDLTTASGTTELMRRVAEAAKEACAQVHTADAGDLSDMDDTSCMRTATDSALKRAKAAIDQRREPTVRFSLPK